MLKRAIASLPRVRLAKNWRKLHRSYTVRLSVLLALLSAAQEQWPLFQPFLQPKHFAIVSASLAVAIAVFRHIEQPCTHADNDDDKH
jgi:hypothetical protein